jgi:hypothetical protein
MGKNNQGITRAKLIAVAVLVSRFSLLLKFGVVLIGKYFEIGN